MVGFGGQLLWDGNDKDDIIPLLNHSDCDDELTISECKQIAPRLRELVEKWDDEDYDKQRALMLADGMDEAVECNETFKFC